MEEFLRSYDAVIPANVRYNKELSANEKLLYGEIRALSNQEGYCWASNAYFAELYNTSIRTVQVWLSNLISEGYVKSEMEYRKGSKEVERRYLSINVVKKSSWGGEKNLMGGGEKNFMDNKEQYLNKKQLNNKYIVEKLDSTSVKAIVDYLNLKTGKSFKASTDKTKRCINARLKEGFTVDDFKKVIDIKTSKWLKDPNMAQYLRPETLFGTKFESYLNEKPSETAAPGISSKWKKGIGQ